jgi:hypothetical protein
VKICQNEQGEEKLIIFMPKHSIYCFVEDLLFLFTLPFCILFFVKKKTIHKNLIPFTFTNIFHIYVPTNHCAVIIIAKYRKNKLFYSNFCRHTTRDIIEALPNVGLVINLTNTQTGSKYYEPNDWKSRDIDYKWIKVEGE